MKLLSAGLLVAIVSVAYGQQCQQQCSQFGTDSDQCLECYCRVNPQDSDCQCDRQCRNNPNEDACWEQCWTQQYSTYCQQNPNDMECACPAPSECGNDYDDDYISPGCMSCLDRWCQARPNNEDCVCWSQCKQNENSPGCTQCYSNYCSTNPSNPDCICYNQCRDNEDCWERCWCDNIPGNARKEECLWYKTTGQTGWDDDDWKKMKKRRR